MVFSYLVLTLVGVALGFLTGIIPGVHINLVAVAFTSLSAYLLRFLSPLEAGILLFTTAVSHNFADNISSTFLGIPASDKLTSIIPSHKLVVRGYGFDVLRFAMLGMLASIAVLIIASPLLFFFVDDMYAFVSPFIPYILLGIVAILIIRENRKVIALIVVLIAGVLGLLVFSMKGLHQPLLPMLSGLFGVSSLFLSYHNDCTIPQQQKNKTFDAKKVKLVQSSGSAFLASLATSFLPGLSSSHTSLLATSFFKKVSDESVVFIANFCNMMAMFFGLIAVIVIQKARSGVVVALSGFLELDMRGMLIIGACSLFALFFTVLGCLRMNKLFFLLMKKVNYKLLCIGVLLFLVILTGIVSGMLGLLVVACCFAVGVFANMTGVSKNNLMACIILPVALYMLM